MSMSGGTRGRRLNNVNCDNSHSPSFCIVCDVNDSVASLVRHVLGLCLL